MAKKDKQTVQLIDGVDPGLFGQKCAKNQC